MTGVISALAAKQKHVPFRDSKLTYLLSSSLRLLHAYTHMHACMGVCTCPLHAYTGVCTCPVTYHLSSSRRLFI